MQKTLFILTIIFLFSYQKNNAQQAQKPNSAEIYNQIKKLNFLGSVLYIAAHPDDENTRLISYLSNETMARTGYLSLTRGDGGQNLLGSQLREELGVIRTQELIEARKIDGGEQFFSRANDFGYSKSPEETLQIWDKEKVLADIVWIIRNFQPDIIINRFDHRTSGNTHGHHTASAILSVESFDLSNNPSVFPNQLKLVQPWQVKRQFFNIPWGDYGFNKQIDTTKKSNLFTLQTGVFYPYKGKSNQEIASLSYSSHQSQGFGCTEYCGDDTVYLELINGDASKDKSTIFEGIDTTWNRVQGGKAIGELISNILQKFDLTNPSASISDLTKAYSMIQSLNEKHWKTIKLEELKKIIASCAELSLEAISQNQEATPGSVIKIKLEALNKSDISMQLISIKTLPEQKTLSQNINLKKEIPEYLDLDILLPQNIEYTQPYWLIEKRTEGMYTVADQKNIGAPDIIKTVKIIFNIQINGIEIPFEKMVIYKDPTKKKIENYLEIVPEVTTTFLDNVSLFKDNTTKTISIKIKAGKDSVKGNLQLELPKNWSVSPKFIPFDLDKKDKEQVVYFEVTPPILNEEIVAKSIITINGKKYNENQIFIDYNHISKQQILKPSESKFIRLDLKTNDEKIGYIMGAGDEVPNSLKQMGYKVTLIKPEEITLEKLDSFDVLVTGIRAYNTIQALAYKQTILFDFVNKGKVMLVQYNTINDILVSNIAPFPLEISLDRVTEENAEVQFLTPNHPVLNYPNKITSNDFKGWKQEQGLYYPKVYDNAFTPILSSNDKGETPKKGALLIAPYGKGYYIYTGLSFFRELPEGITGAFRLFANLISLESSEKISAQKNILNSQYEK